MPLQQILPTWLALNAANDVSPSGMVDLRTGAPVYAGGLDVGDYFDVTEKEAFNHSYSVNGTLHAGRYRRVQLAANATVANQGIGKLGFMPLAVPTALIPGSLNIVTTQDLGLVPTAGLPGRVVIFLNVITPGNYGFVQELGIANVFVNAAVTAAGSVNVGTLGNAAPGGTTSQIGVALQTIAAAGLALTLLNLPVVQG